jgi:hypothetical protein
MADVEAEVAGSILGIGAADAGTAQPKAATEAQGRRWFSGVGEWFYNRLTRRRPRVETLGEFLSGIFDALCMLLAVVAAELVLVPVIALSGYVLHELISKMYTFPRWFDKGVEWGIGLIVLGSFASAVFLFLANTLIEGFQFITFRVNHHGARVDHHDEVR